MIDDLDIIHGILTSGYFGFKITKDDLYVIGGKLFVNQDGEISIYSYPMNEYFECDDTMLNLSSLSFKAFIDMYVNRTIN
jgi:hypothetical protein